MRKFYFKGLFCRLTPIFILLFLLSACAAAPIKEKPKLFWPLPPDAPKISFVDTWTQPSDIGVAPSFFKRIIHFVFGKPQTAFVIRPTGVVTDLKGGVYVADSGLQVVHYFDTQNKSYSQLYQLSRTLRLQNPIGVAVDAAGLLYVSDSDLNRVYVFDQERKMVREIGTDEEITRISGLALDPVRERLYVVDTMGHRILTYSLEGKLLGQIGKRGIAPGTFNFPTFATVDDEGSLYVSDSLNFRVQVFNAKGEYRFHLGALGRNLGEFSRPKGVAVDRDKNIYVVDTLFDTVQVFNPEGELLLKFGKSGVKPGTFWLPSGIAVDQSGRIFVADSYNQRIQVFKLLEDKKEGLNETGLSDTVVPEEKALLDLSQSGFSG